MPEKDEFSLIARLFAPLAAGHAGAMGLTDDCALFAGPDNLEWAVTADAMVAGVHFFADDPADLIARKLIRVNLSDLAAKGAEPRLLMMTVCFPKDVSADWLDSFGRGLQEDCAAFGVSLIGGDTVSTPGPLTLSLTALGVVPRGKALLRSGAQTGDVIWLSGTVGDGAFGLAVQQGQHDLPPVHYDFLLNRYRLPQPRVQLGVALRGIATASMDVSDGLVADLEHLCDCSGLGAEIISASLPLSSAVQAAMAAGIGQGVVTALTGGDDYEVLFTAPADKTPEIHNLSVRLGLRLTAIGRIIPQTGVCILGDDGKPMRVCIGGYNHFPAETA